ncbi:MAG: hypothetical protein FWD51_01035 [Betaproteobacteria bacterium]|nr:hypothetical protein [Betaproteobacteria bacterium]
MSYVIMERLRSRKRQCGQAIYLGLAAIVFLSLMTYAAFNISQMTHAKTQTMNAADAGAYTAATVVARDLNFMAYSNRAMVANHAVIGQLVSLASLSQMIYLAADDIATISGVLKYIPGIGAIFGALESAFKGIKTAIEDFILPGLETLANGQNLLIRGISKMQLLVHGATAKDVSEAVEKVIKANDPELEWAVTDIGGLATASNIGAGVETFFGKFSKQVPSTDSAGLGRMREVVNLSRDGFTIERNWLEIPGFEIPFFFKFNTQYLFGGGTQLSEDNKTWMGVDGFEFIYKTWKCSKTGCYWKTGYVQMWLTGEVAGSSDADDWAQLSHGDLTSGAHSKAHGNRKFKMQNTYSGIQPYQELTTLKPGDRSDDSPTYTVLVYKPVQSNSTPNATQTFNTTDANNPFHLEEGRARIYGVAASQVYFRRPAANDNDPTAGNSLPNTLYAKGTYATLFAPYWQARLKDLPSELAAALMAVGD